MAEPPAKPRNASKAAQLALAVASGETVKLASERLGIAERTARGWSASEWFRAEVRELRNQLVSETVGKLTEASTAAVGVLAKEMREGDSSAARISAARTILDKTVSLTEIHDLAERLRQLEERLHESQGPY